MCVGEMRYVVSFSPSLLDVCFGKMRAGEA
jgi:hypothetical protein